MTEKKGWLPFLVSSDQSLNLTWCQMNSLCLLNEHEIYVTQEEIPDGESSKGMWLEKAGIFFLQTISLISKMRFSLDHSLLGKYFVVGIKMVFLQSAKPNNSI